MAVSEPTSEPGYWGLPQDEIARRYRLVREAAARDGFDAVLVCGNEYTGFEGAVTYLSGFVIVHRYAYVLLPVDGEPEEEPPAHAVTIATDTSITQERINQPAWPLIGSGSEPRRRGRPRRRDREVPGQRARTGRESS